MAEAAERRQYVRMALTLNINFTCLRRGYISPPYTSWTENISMGGLAMASPQPMLTNQLLMVSLHLQTGANPPAVKVPLLNDHPDVFILARVVWTRKLDTPEERHQYGLQFLDLPLASRRLFKQFLKERDLLGESTRLCLDTDVFGYQNN